MSIVESIVRDERRRLQELLVFYDSEIGLLPKGSLVIKKQIKQQYAYLAHREGKKVEFDYLGKAESKKVSEIKKKIEERREVEALRRDAKQGLKDVESLLRGKKI